MGGLCVATTLQAQHFSCTGSLYDARVRSVSNTVAMSGCMGIYEVVVIHFRKSCTETFIKLVKQIPLLARAIYIINGWLMFCWLVCMQRYHCRSDPAQVQSTSRQCLWITLDCNNSLYSCCTDDELQAHLSWWLSNRELKCAPRDDYYIAIPGKSPGFFHQPHRNPCNLSMQEPARTI